MTEHCTLWATISQNLRMVLLDWHFICNFVWFQAKIIYSIDLFAVCFKLKNRLVFCFLMWNKFKLWYEKHYHCKICLWKKFLDVIIFSSPEVINDITNWWSHKLLTSQSTCRDAASFSQIVLGLTVRSDPETFLNPKSLPLFLSLPVPFPSSPTSSHSSLFSLILALSNCSKPLDQDEFQTFFKSQGQWWGHILMSHTDEVKIRKTHRDSGRVYRNFSNDSPDRKGQRASFPLFLTPFRFLSLF